LADLGPSLREFAGYNPLFGQGFGTRVTGFDTTFGNAPILDDQWLKTLLETGLLGIAGWIWLFFAAVRRLGRRAKAPGWRDDWLPVALAASIAAFGVCMLTYDAYSFTQGTFLLHIMLGFAAVLLWLPERGAPDQRAWSAPASERLPRGRRSPSASLRSA
jgi:O-antigen ligase